MRSALPNVRVVTLGKAITGRSCKRLFRFGIKVEAGLAPAALRKEVLLEQRCFMRPL